MVTITQSALIIRQLARQIEQTWRRYLSLLPYNIPDNLGYVEGNLEGEKLIIENCCYQTPQFRKLHLELARLGDRLDILHCVMFPRTNYDLPIFGVDLVGSQGRIGAAIVDLSPINSHHRLSSAYRQFLTNLSAIRFSQTRTLPPWGDIFSEFCLFARLSNTYEEKAFLRVVQQYLTLHCQNSRLASPVTCLNRQTELLAGQRYYCKQQKQNDKTRRVLEKSLGKEWTDNYLNQMLFDCP